MTYPSAVWPYSPYVIVWDTIYFSWQIWLDPETMELESCIEKQTQRVCENISWVCDELWIGLGDICKTTIFLKNIADFQEVNSIYEQYFSHKPARSCVAVADLPKWALVEIECIAYKK